ncbi:Hsp20/alpha crystallin family protein [Crenobacter cavernae]|uniref:Hsp20/alpha crystallin family protein n=1 Tax=Crenobacter cavernae TaxID=2290923 RepID=A0A345Y5P3_9NEIS|nr:Hsp20/alpha crystallin family protein [Crenobacter cavernae]AXK39245.1 Hsp20/alpha crystallin family protein [Crenobacter cavernae]
MANQPQFDPGRALANYDPFNVAENMRKLFGGFFLQENWMSPVRWMTNIAQQGMTIDIAENDESYTVLADIPGVKKEDITVEIAGNRITISAETKSGKEERKGDAIIQSERHYGSFFRSFILDKNVDDDKVAAKYTDGVLELTIPKKNGGQGKQISIH